MKSWLDSPLLYLMLQSAIGAMRARRLCLERYALPLCGERVLDVGCGPGYVVDYLPTVDYVGFDIDRKYIDYARRKYGDRGEFHCTELTDTAAASLGQFDLIMLNGVVHHIDDATAIDLFRILRGVLKPGGRLMTLDGCYREGMSRASRFFLDNDRGEFVRWQSQYERLAFTLFEDVTATHRGDLFWIPYDALVMICRCRKSNANPLFEETQK